MQDGKRKIIKRKKTHKIAKKKSQKILNTIVMMAILKKIKLASKQ